jgi:hypothetical protein
MLTHGGWNPRTEQILPDRTKKRQLFDILAQFVLVREEIQQDLWPNLHLTWLLSGECGPRRESLGSKSRVLAGPPHAAPY